MHKQTDIDTLPIGTILKGKSYTYQIEKRLGQGTFGITYLASVKMSGDLGAIDANVKVAIKEFFMRDINGRSDTNVTSGGKGGVFGEYKRKFIREAINLSKLHHPNIIKVIESFEDNNTIYYVMEYIDGGSLDDYITKNKRLKAEETIKIVNQISSALSFMHDQGMLHLDLKPNNIMRKDTGDVVLIDFGLSKQYDESGEPESSTKVGAGTPGYSPIEQANYREGKGFPVTMDVYALGGTMYKMLTGIRPPEASEILNDGFPYGILVQCGVCQSLRNCIEKAMSPMKKDRYQSVKELSCDLDVVRLEEQEADANEQGVHVDDDEVYVCEVPVLYDDKYWGEYVVEIGEAEYGTNELVRKKVKGHIPVPNSILITITPNTGYDELAYEIILNKNDNSIVRIGHKGVVAESALFGIPDDVMDYFINNGYFSPVHWERERTTTMPGRVIVSCIFAYTDGTSYRRSCDLTSNHTLLLYSIENLLKKTSLSKCIDATLLKLKMAEKDNEKVIVNSLPKTEGIFYKNKAENADIQNKDKKEAGCFMSAFTLLAVGIHITYPLLWLLTFLNNSFSYPNVISLIAIWFIGIVIGIIVSPKNGINKTTVFIWWILLIVETAVVYFINYV